MRRSPNRLLGVIIGAVYLLLGILGFALTPSVGFVATDGALLAGTFELNGLQNVVHLGLGAVLLLAGLSNVRVASVANATVGGVFLLLGLGGLFLIGTAQNALALNSADNALHFATAALLLAVGLGAEQPRDTAPSRRAAQLEKGE